MNCPICSSPVSEPVPELYALPSITSDCRPWEAGRSVTLCSGCGVMKRDVSPWTDFNSIYKNYKSYPEPSGRTDNILRFAKDRMPLPKTILDMGCGQGEGIKVLASHYPDVSICGYEPTICDNRPTQKFDLITLFHVFEHVEDLSEVLAYIKSSLTENGHLLIQVPYPIMGAFDLVIADHIWHFSKESIAKLLNQSGFEIIYLGNDCVKKEITLLAKEGGKILYEDEIHKEGILVDWLLSYKASLDKINEPVAIYGTGPAAAWAGNILGNKVVYYLDDDPSRRATKFNEKMVYPPLFCGLPVVAPFPDWQLEEIKNKNQQLRFLC